MGLAARAGMEGESPELSDAGVVRGRVGRDGAQGQGLAPGMGADCDAAVDGGGFLPGIASGELRLQAFGVTEPTSGSNTLALRTTAVRKGSSHYVVNGQKVWMSRAEYSDLMLLLARTTPAAEVKKRTDGLSVFLLDMREAKRRGLTIRPIRTMVNHSTTEVFFDDLEIPADSLIGEEGKGFRYILTA